ncbi:MAG: SCP2 sterol-binding domain-containing protein [Promethearchaeota archaeon]
MPIFLSEEWINQYVEKLNSNEAYNQAAKTWEGDFFFVVRDKDNNIIKMGYFDLWHGKCRDAFEVKDFDNPGKDPEFIYDGKLENWKKVLKRELDPIQALMTGKFKLVSKSPSGMTKVMRAVKAAQELVNTTTMLQTEFPE